MSQGQSGTNLFFFTKLSGSRFQTLKLWYKDGSTRRPAAPRPAAPVAAAAPPQGNGFYTN